MERNSYAAFHPVTAAWFTQTFGEPTEVQHQAWRSIAADRHTLIASPTGSGKTMAALLPCLDRIVRRKLEAGAGWQAGVRVLYVTPLKALNNDIYRHLFQFVDELGRLAERGEERTDDSGQPLIRIGLRTGDTTQQARASMLKAPPDVLITTPESLYLLLGSHKSRVMLQTIEQVIVDEIHSLAADKRGVHLSVSLERLAAWCGRNPQRIGVSATQKPLERVARFLGGWEEADEGREAAAEEDRLSGNGGDALPEADRTVGHDAEADPPPSADDRMRPRPVDIVASGMEKHFSLSVTMPSDARRPAADREKVWAALVERMLELMEGCRTALVFVNNRRLSERLTLRLNDYVGYEMALAHHGSVSRERRLEVEERLKAGELRCLVATSSLELGIDVGHVDLVIQIDSPKQAAAGIQRIGRAGHAVGDVSRGVIVARSRGELAEAAVLARQIAARDIEPIRVPRRCLDVASQQLVAMVAADDWEVGQLHRLLTRSDCYRGFPRERLEAALQVLAGYYPFARPLIDWDRDAGMLRRRTNTAMAALTGAGTIPQSSAYPVHHAATRLHIGELEEEFVHESGVGDVFQLGASSWMIREIGHDRVYVLPSANGLSEIPFWRAEAAGRSVELGRRIGQLHRELEEALVAEAGQGMEREALAAEAGQGTERAEEQALSAVRERLGRDCFLDRPAADSLIGLLRAHHAVCPLPTDKRVVIERFNDETGGLHVVIHCLLGRKLNRTWQLALQALFARAGSGRIYAGVRDSGIELVFPHGDASWREAQRQLHAGNVRELLLEALPASSQFAATFRRLAQTSLLLSRSFKRMPAWQMRLRSEELMHAALPYAERFPYLREAMEECLGEQLDAAGLAELLAAIARGEVELAECRTLYPSPLAAQFLADYVNTAMYEADGFAQDVQSELIGVSRRLAAEWFGEDTVRDALEPEVVAGERQRLEDGAGLLVESAEALYRLFKERGDMTEAEALRLAGSADAAGWLDSLRDAGRIEARDIAGERRFICRDERHTYASFPAEREAADFVLRRYIDHRLSFTGAELQTRYGLTAPQADAAISGWRERAAIERAPFAGPDEPELWTSAAVAARIVRLSLQSYRRRIAPVTADRFCSELAALHRIGPAAAGTAGAGGLLEAIDRLQGIFLPVSYWESFVLPARIPGYRKEELDELISSGEVMWIGRKEEGDKEGRIAFFRAEAEPLYAPYALQPKPPTRHPELLALLERRGASFLSALSGSSGLPPSELLGQLLDLVWEGRAANDRFAPLRNSLRPGTQQKFNSGLGRWYALTAHEAEPADAAQRAIPWAHHLLRQFAVVTKETVASSGCPYSWETMASMYKRLEEWGMVTRGMFVEGVESLQFTARETVAALRGGLPAQGGAAGSLVAIAAVDPANPYGLTVPWPRGGAAQFARKPGNYIVLQDGKWALWLEQYGKSIVTMERDVPTGAWADELRVLFRALLRQPGLRKIVVAKWNGRRAADSEAAGLLARIGAERDRDGFVLWPSALQ